jgi:hypothetical protein
MGERPEEPSPCTSSRLSGNGTSSAPEAACLALHPRSPSTQDISESSRQCSTLTSLLKAAATLENATQGSDLWETSIILLDYRTLTTRQKETSEYDGQSFEAEGTHEGSQGCLCRGAVAAAAGLKYGK